jgi:hypothetical protein
MIPQNLQTTNMKRFQGFTPQQVQKLLQSRGLQPDSREAAEYLAAMADKAEDLLNTKNPVKPVQKFSGIAFNPNTGKYEMTSQLVVNPSGSVPPPSDEGVALLQGLINQQRDPLTPGTPSTYKTALDTAQGELAAEQQKVAGLYQQLAVATDEAERKRIQQRIEKAQPGITAKEAKVASASESFQTTSVPTAAEAVGATVSTPQDMITKQPVDLLKFATDQKVDEAKGTVGSRTDATTDTGTTEDATATAKPTITKAETDTVTQGIRDESLSVTDGKLTSDAKATAQTMAIKDLGIQDVEAATLDSYQTVKSPSKRILKSGELVSGAANAERASLFTEGIEAATGAPSTAATVQGQLTSLMTQFEGGEPPAWAAGAMRQATAVMAQRGMAASSMAGQALVQAAMESALPIALQDAQTVARFEEQNLSNRQQRAMLSAQQRAQFLGMEFDQAFQARVQNAAKISDIANTNFSTEVQIALENSRMAQTTDLSNLGNKQAVIMAQAASIADTDMANLNNKQQVAIRNAQAFLQQDMTNIQAQQQLDMFQNQSIIQGMFSDQAATNAASQFNATSQNQTDQFFARLETQVSEFNAAQNNAMEQFNAGETNAITKLNNQLNNQRDMFNAQNKMVIAQANAQWRQQLATINNAALNEANRQNALQANGLTQKGLDEIWQKERDLMAYAFATAESAKERKLKMVLQDKQSDQAGDSAFSGALGDLGSALITGIFSMYS